MVLEAMMNGLSRPVYGEPDGSGNFRRDVTVVVRHADGTTTKTRNIIRRTLRAVSGENRG